MVTRKDLEDIVDAMNQVFDKFNDRVSILEMKLSQMKEAAEKPSSKKKVSEK